MRERNTTASGHGAGELCSPAGSPFVRGDTTAELPSLGEPWLPPLGCIGFSETTERCLWRHASIESGRCGRCDVNASDDD